MSSYKDSDLLKIRQMGNNNPNNLRQIAARIYDKKLKSFLSLQTKQQVLQHCQQLLINKTVDYMNVITQLEMGQLKSLNSLNDLLYEKSNTMGNLSSTLTELKQVNKEQAITITFLNKDIEVLRKQQGDMRIRLQVTEERLIKTVQQGERKNNHLKSQFYEMKSNLEKQIKELTRQLQQKIQQLKTVTGNCKSDIAYLKSQQDKQMMQLNKKYKDIISGHEMNKEDIMKDKKYLQDLIEVKDDEIREAKREKNSVSPKKWLLGSGGKIDIVVKPMETSEVVGDVKARPRSGRMVVEKSKKEEGKKAEGKDSKDNKDGKESKKKEREKKEQKQKNIDSFKQKQKEKQKQKNIIQTRDFGLQFGDNKNLSIFSPCQFLSKTQCSVQTQIEDPTQNTTDQAEIRLRGYLDKQYKVLFDEKVKQLNMKYIDEYKKATNDAKSLIYDLAVLTKDQIKLSNTKLLQMQTIYEQRPSRQEDLVYIASLILQNKSLMGLCSEANQKTDSAYVALQQYHCKLQSYKKLVPMNINGSIPPSVHNTKQLISKAGRSQSIRPFNSNNSWMISEPNTSRRMNRTSKHQNQSFELTKDILVTDFEMSNDLASPLKRKHMQMRPQTSNILSMKRKSAMY